MSKTFCFLLITIFHCFSQKIGNTNQNSFVEIEFQDGFINDTVTVIFGNCKLVEKNVLTSSFVNGTTGLYIIGFKDNKKIKAIIKDADTNCDTENTDSLDLQILVNSAPVQKFNLDVSKGKYFGFDLNRGNNKLSFFQLSRPFKHD